MKYTQKDALLIASEGINSVIDNWDVWSPEQIRQHLWALQGVLESARKK